MKVTEADARHAGICARMRPWFRKHGLDWDAFCRGGIEAETLLAVGDQTARIELAIEEARKRVNEQR